MHLHIYRPKHIKTNATIPKTHYTTSVQPLARLGALVTGIDALPEAIKAARDHAASQPDDTWPSLPNGTGFRSPTYLCTSLHSMAAELSPDNQNGKASIIGAGTHDKEMALTSNAEARYDAVVMSELLEHVEDWRSMIEEANLLLKSLSFAP
ncbi:unnamed protein product [Protopolystoma xenopodis]|uniref:Uncharacterized protein n=1 Tax=Protopolystoma xenopodis TaxID=117903 RepID=A0A448XBC1_9PLAT|nr:unnamed protein product [Protopolystoma xenopodis]